MKTIYLPIGVPTFHLESAREAMKKTARLIRAVDPEAILPDDLLLSVSALESFLKGQEAGLAIVQNATFASAAYAEAIMELTDAPLLLWTLPEPVADGTRLRLNSLTGAFSAGNAFKQKGRPFLYFYGSPELEEARETLETAVAAARAREALSRLVLLNVGTPPEGFSFGTAHGDLLDRLGIKRVCISPETLMEGARALSEEQAAPYLERARGRIKGLDGIARDNVLDFARLWAAYDAVIGESGAGAVASRCWPDFFTKYGTPVCAVLSMLTDDGIPAACEGDAYGAVSMFLGQKLTKKPAFFGDPVAFNEGENTLTFWHCGTGACSLAREEEGAQAGVHCNRKIGPTLEFGCRAEKEVTLFRLGVSPEGKLRFFLAEGEALEKPKQFYGTSIAVRTQEKVRALVERTVKEGWEPHYAVVMGKVGTVLKTLAVWTGIEA